MLCFSSIRVPYSWLFSKQFFVEVVKSEFQRFLFQRVCILWISNKWKSMSKFMKMCLCTCQKLTYWENNPQSCTLEKTVQFIGGIAKSCPRSNRFDLGPAEQTRGSPARASCSGFCWVVYWLYGRSNSTLQSSKHKHMSGYWKEYYIVWAIVRSRASKLCLVVGISNKNVSKITSHRCF